MNKHYHIYGIGAALVDTEITLSDADLTRMAVAKGVMTLVDEARQNTLIDYLSDHLVASHRASGGSGHPRNEARCSHPGRCGRGSR